MAEYIPLSDFAAKLGVSEEIIQDLRDRGKLRAFRDGSSWKFKDDELEKAKTILAEEGLAGDESQEFELSGGPDSEDGSSGSMDSLLIEDTGEGGDGGSSNIISNIDDSAGDIALSLPDSDLGLEDSLVSNTEESGLSSLDLGDDSSIDKPAEDEFSLVDDGELSLTDEESEADINLGGEPLDPEGTGSGLSLALEDESLDLGTSGIGMDHDSSGELSLDIEDDEDSSMDLLASEDELSLADEAPIPSNSDDSEIDLISDSSESGEIGLAASDDSFSLSSGDSGLDLLAEESPEPAAKGIAASDDEELFEPAAAADAAEGDFLLTPVEGELEDDDSGSQVIALDSDSMSSESGLFGSSTLEGGDFGGLGDSDGLEADDAMAASSGSGTMAQAAPAAAAPADISYTGLEVGLLGATALMLMACGLMVTDLMWNTWSFSEPYSISSTIMDSILGLLPS
ncbi:DNA-binding protein [Bremerella cremea]|uniref:DNA-binding protein n=1 Tax=Bremerella cremea TaxID=1031537 RepID=A0A368KQR5_9BACT|nr:DNA-binding protein [Bremerella cremea]RCS49214.1 DNA-binding protein [Bremerella cremea]